MSEKAQAMIEVGANGALTPRNFEGLWRLSQVMAASGFMPKGMEREESVFVAVQMGMEVGLSPMQAVQNIASINGRPAIWGDAMLGLVRGSGLLLSISETIEGTGDATEAVCTVTRKGDQGETVGRFSVADAKRAALWDKSGPWKQYPKRMLQMRARAFALRDKFPDVIKGLYAREELHGEVHMGAAEVVTSKAALASLKPAKAKAEPLDLTPAVPGFADAMEWISTAQTKEDLDLAMDAARDIEIDAEARRELDTAAAAQLALIEGIDQ
jgi:hypothetical protein